MDDASNDAQYKRFYDHLFQLASTIVAKGKPHVPMIVVLDTKGNPHCIAPIGIDSEQQATLFMALADNPHTYAAALIMEYWYVDFSHDPADANRCLELASQRKLHQHPDRQEAIVISILTAARQAVMVCPIHPTTRSLTQAPFQWIDENGAASVTGRYVRPPRQKSN